MKYLKIDNNKGYYVDKEDQYNTIDTIKKEDLLFLLECATNHEIEFEMDEITDDNLKNEAHHIIYQELYGKFNELLNNRDKFLDESENLYKDAFDKYKEHTE